MSRALRALALFVALLVYDGSAVAAPSELLVRPVDEPAPLLLTPDARGAARRFVVENRGTRSVSAAVGFVEGPPGRPRHPEGLEVTFIEGGARVTLPSGQSRQAAVRWLTDRSRAAQVFAEVQVLDGDTPVATLGVHSLRPECAGPLGVRAPSLLLTLPLFGLLLLAALGRTSRVLELRYVPLGVAAAELALFGVLASRFDPLLSQLDGTAGYQLVQRSVLSPGYGVEWALGIDGPSLALGTVSALSLLAAALLGGAPSQRVASYWALVLTLHLAALGVVLSLDLALTTLAAALVATTVALLLARFGGDGGRQFAVRYAVLAAVGLVSLGFAAQFLASHAEGVFLADGSAAARSFSLVELSYGSLVGRGLSLFGWHAIKGVWLLLFVGFGALFGLPPFASWVPGALSRLPSGAALVLAGSALPLGGFGLLRVGVNLDPVGTQWAAPALCLLGASVLAIASLAAFAASDLRRFAGYAWLANSGVLLLGLGSLTAVGSVGALCVLTASTLACVALVACAGVLRDRVSSSDVSEFGGLARELPLYALLLGVSLAASLGAPGTAGLYGVAQALYGLTAREPYVSLIADVGVMLFVAAHARLLSLALLGKLDERWAKSKFLEAHGGRLPGLHNREIVALGGLALVLVLGGIYPRPWLALFDSAALDLGALVDAPGPAQIP